MYGRRWRVLMFVHATVCERLQNMCQAQRLVVLCSYVIHLVALQGPIPCTGAAHLYWFRCS